MREREREGVGDQPPIGAAKLHDTPTAQAAASSSFECASFCEEKKKAVSHVHHAPSTYRHPNNNIIKLMIIKMTHSIELVDCCDEFAHLMSNDTGQVDKRTLWKHAPSYHKGNTCEQENYM